VFAFWCVIIGVTSIISACVTLCSDLIKVTQEGKDRGNMIEPDYLALLFLVYFLCYRQSIPTVLKSYPTRKN